MQTQKARDAAEGVSTVDLGHDDDLDALVTDALVNLPPAPEGDSSAGEPNDVVTLGTAQADSEPKNARPFVSAIFDVERPDEVVVAPPKLHRRSPRQRRR